MRIHTNSSDLVATKRLFNLSSEANLVSQTFVKQINLATPKLCNTQQLISIDGRQIQAYSVHIMTFEVTNVTSHT